MVSRRKQAGGLGHKTGGHRSFGGLQHGPDRLPGLPNRKRASARLGRDRFVFETFESRVLLSGSPVLTGPQTIDEGCTYTVNVDPGSNVDSWSIDWGDNSQGDAFNFDHIYSEPGMYGIVMHAVYFDGGVMTNEDSNVLAVAVQNVVPVVSAGENQIATLGQMVSLTGSLVWHPGSDAVTDPLWEVIDSQGQVVSRTWTYVLDFTPTEADVYTATFSLMDAHYGVGTDSATITVPVPQAIPAAPHLPGGRSDNAGSHQSDVDRQLLRRERL